MARMPKINQVKLMEQMTQMVLPITGDFHEEINQSMYILIPFCI